MARAQTTTPKASKTGAANAPQPAPEPARTPRNRETPDVRRKSLIQATMRSIAKHGYAGTTIEKICEEAQVSRGLINHHFGSKDELIRQSYKTLCEDWKYHAHDSLDSQREPEDELRAVIHVSFSPKFFKTEYLSIWMGFWSVIGKSPALKKLNRDVCAQDLAIFQTLFERIAARRGIALDARAGATALLALMDGLWLQWCLDPKSFTVQQAEAACLDYVARIFP